MNSGINPLILVTFFPVLGVLVILLLKKEWKTAARWTALATSLVTFGLALWVLSLFDQRSEKWRQFQI